MCTCTYYIHVNVHIQCTCTYYIHVHVILYSNNVYYMYIDMIIIVHCFIIDSEWDENCTKWKYSTSSKIIYKFTNVFGTTQVRYSAVLLPYMVTSDLTLLPLRDEFHQKHKLWGPVIQSDAKYVDQEISEWLWNNWSLEYDNFGPPSFDVVIGMQLGLWCCHRNAIRPLMWSCLPSSALAKSWKWPNIEHSNFNISLKWLTSKTSFQRASHNTYMTISGR